jgi:hypothetical protein
MKGNAPAHGEIIAKEENCTENFLKILQNQQANFDQTWYK